MEKESGFVFFDSLNSILSSETFQIPLQQSHCSVVQNLVNFNWKGNTPKTLLCHDHRGGYLDYESLIGTQICAKESEDGSTNVPFYSFFHWWHIDVFVYFSHHFITIPPFSWTNQAHKHGILILGTFIIENDQLCQQTFAEKETIDKLVTSLVKCCVLFNFDGWLINIESEVLLADLDNLEYFLLTLRDETHVKVHNDTKIIWYDSVTLDGKLEWQNALNANNLRWFNVVDGFYTNYAWKEEHIEQTLCTVLSAPNKSLSNVYIGIDVFGRGCMGDGGWNCVQPMELIRRYALSAAIFAPGWICEKFSTQSHQILFDNSFRFWNTLAPFLYSHKMRQRNICTNFVVGFASEHLDWRSKKQTENNHFCLQNANLQPFYGCSSAFSKDMSAGLLVTGPGIHHLFLCNIPIEETDERIELRYHCSHQIRLIVTVTNGKESLHFCERSSDDDGSSDETKNNRSEKCAAFEVGGKGGWKILNLSLFNTATVPIRLYMVGMKLH